MKTIIMAGGEGKRLRPLTCSLPKPLLPLLEKPIIEYILDLLYLHKISSAVITTGYMGEKIEEHFPNKKYRGIDLTFSSENIPLGTAGGVKNAMKGIRDDALVISGDALCDFNLSEAIKFHRNQKSAVTIIGKKVSDPREYGLLELSGNRVSGFLEKPDFSKVFSSVVNTGIYILSERILGLIPDGNCDFGKDIFPKLLEMGEEISVFEEEGYWCDIGSIKTYISCQHDILKGKVFCERQKDFDVDNNIINSQVPENAKVFPPVYIGKGVLIEEGSVICEGSVIESGSRILSGAKIKGSVIKKNSLISQRASISGAVVGDKAKIERAASVYEEAVIGEGATVGKSSVVLPFIKVWPYKQVDGDTIQRENVKEGGLVREIFGETGISGEDVSLFNPTLSLALGRSVGSLEDKKKIFLGSDGSDISMMLCLGFISGVLSTGKDVYFYENINKPKFLWEGKRKNADISLYISKKNKGLIEFYHSDGLSIPRETERNIEENILREDYILSSASGKIKFCRADESYMESFFGLIKGDFRGNKADIVSENSGSDDLRSVLSALSLEKGGISYRVSSDGVSASAFSEETGVVSSEKLLLLAALYLFMKGENVALPETAPRVVSDIAAFFSLNVLRYARLSCGKDTGARALAEKQDFLRDGAKIILLVLAFLRDTGLTLASALKLLPPFLISERKVKISESVGEILSKFSDEERIETKEGICFKKDKGIVFLIPTKRGKEIKIYSESYSEEFSKELISGVEKILSGNLDTEQKK